MTEMLRRYCDFDCACKAGSIFWQATPLRVHSGRQCPLLSCPTAESSSAWSVCNTNTIIPGISCDPTISVKSPVSGIWTSSFFTTQILSFEAILSSCVPTLGNCELQSLPYGMTISKLPAWRSTPCQTHLICQSQIRQSWVCIEGSNHLPRRDASRPIDCQLSSLMRS